MAQGIAETRDSAAGAVLKGAAAVWFAVAMAGQWAFFYYLAAFYGASTLTGHAEIWNRLQAIGRTPYLPGDHGGNAAYAAHVLAAGYIAFGGALQLIPQVRRTAPALHRWNGRLFVLTVIGLSLSGFYLDWIRHTSPGLTDAISTTINGCLIIFFAFLAWRTAVARNIGVHRRWAMRLYLVSNAQWFLRIGVFGYFVVAKLIGAHASFHDPAVKFWTFGCYLVPLATLELYFRARDRGGALGQAFTAVTLASLTAVMAVGILAFAIFSQRIISGAPLAFGR